MIEQLEQQQQQYFGSNANGGINGRNGRRGRWKEKARDRDKERVLLKGPCITLRFFMLLTQPQLVLCYGGKELLFLLPPSIELLLAATATATVVKSHYPWTIVAMSESLDTEKGGNLCGLI